MIWFTADTHFGHANIIRYCDRPYTDVEAMDAHLIDCWNSAVKPDDIVYHLADLTLGDGPAAWEYLAQLNGHIKILSTPWHHDSRWLPLIVEALGGIYPGPARVPTLNSATDAPVILLPPLWVLELPKLGDGKHPLAITLCHYPLAVWDRKHYGAWHLFGHSHGQHENGGFSFDVGVDAHDYGPVSLDQVIWYMRERGWERPTREGR